MKTTAKTKTPTAKPDVEPDVEPVPAEPDPESRRFIFVARRAFDHPAPDGSTRNLKTGDQLDVRNPRISPDTIGKLERARYIFSLDDYEQAVASDKADTRRRKYASDAEALGAETTKNLEEGCQRIEQFHARQIAEELANSRAAVLAERDAKLRKLREACEADLSKLAPPAPLASRAR